MKPSQEMLDAWRAQVDKELAGAPFERLVHTTPEGLDVQPVYTEARAHALLPAPGSLRVCMRVASAAEVAEEVEGGADALWVDGDDAETLAAARASGLTVIAEPDGNRVSTLPFHDAGADAADEIALALSTGVARLRGGAAAAELMLQVAVGRDTFGELCKLRALRLCWAKMIAAAGAPDAPAPLLHAVCSSRTQAQRDPWVNMLRVTTEVFAAALGSADLVTPLAFDEALGMPSAIGRRVARNTALVLREESHLGRVVDPAGGSYYLESRTDALARAAWDRFRALERDGGVDAAMTSGALRDRLAASWQKRAAAIARRKEPVLGVSEFANLDEQLPSVAVRDGSTNPPLPRHRDAEAFEALRDRADATRPSPVALVTLGPPSEHRGRVGYATTFFAAGGLRSHPLTPSEAAGRVEGPPAVACLCGSDERYAAEAATTAAALRDAGCKRIVLAGKPGALEADLRAAGVTHFIFVGCDVAGTLAELLP